MALALVFIGALHNPHDADGPETGSLAASILFNLAVEATHADDRSDAATPRPTVNLDDNRGRSIPSTGTCLLLLTAALGCALIPAFGHRSTRAPAPRSAGAMPRSAHRVSTSSIQLGVQRT